MSAITSLRGAVAGVTDEVESRINGVLEAIENAALALVNTIFGVADIVVTEAFSVFNAIVTVVLGAVENEDIDEISAEASVIVGNFGTSEEEDN